MRPVYYTIMSLHTADILLVEDNSADVQLMVAALKDAKVDNDLYVVNNGDSVMDFLNNDDQLNPKKVRPDLIMLDLNMPNKTGLDVLKELKDHAYFKTIPVIIMTNSSEETDIAQAYEYHANTYVTKPINYKKLVEVVEILEKYWLTAAKLPPNNAK